MIVAISDSILGVGFEAIERSGIELFVTERNDGIHTHSTACGHITGHRDDREK